MSKTLKICWHPVRGGVVARGYVLHPGGAKTDFHAVSDDGALRATARVEKEIRRAYLDAGSTDEFTVDMVGKVRMALAEGWAF